MYKFVQNKNIKKDVTMALVSMDHLRNKTKGVHIKHILFLKKQFKTYGVGGG